MCSTRMDGLQAVSVQLIQFSVQFNLVSSRLQIFLSGDCSGFIDSVPNQFDSVSKITKRTNETITRLL